MKAKSLTLEYKREWVRNNKESRKRTNIKYYNKLDALGLCTVCGGTRDNKTKKCNSCRSKSNKKCREWREQRVKSELCIACSSGSPRAGESQKCKECWLKNTARQRKVSVKDLRALKFDRCPYTGVKLVMGVNASLDHKTPVSRGGTDGAENLQWVSQIANEMKGEWTHEEFLEMCKTIARQSDV